jgi:hypothetical protein
MNRYAAKEITTGFHPQGFRIDKTAPPIDRYTQWLIKPDGEWTFVKPVCFDSLPQDGWVTIDKFDWRQKYSASEK